FADNPSLEAVDLIYRGRPLGSTYDGENAEEIITTFQNIRISGGFDYFIDENWVFNANYTWSNSDMNRITPREYDGVKFQEQILLGAYNPFGTAIVSPDLISPKDGISSAGNSKEDIDQFTFRRVDNSKVTQSVAEAVISGETPLNLPGGAVAIAIGGQYRSLDLSDIPDGRWQTGNNGVLETVPAVYGTQDVYAFFGEMAIPLFDRLEIQTALRYENYGEQGGDTLDPKISAKFDITNNLFARGSWGSSFQTPSLRQLAGSVSIAGVVDPIDPIAGNFSLSVVTLGAPDLTPQSSENINIGLVYRSDAGLDISVDYWTYDYQGLILPGADPQAIIDAVFAGDLPADRVVRDAVGQPQAIYATYENRGSAKANGFDFVARYSMDIFKTSKVTFDLSSTYITKYLSSEFGDILGSRNFANGFGSTPNFKLNGGITLNADNHTVNVTARHIGAYSDGQFNNPIDAQTTIDMRYSLFLEDFLGDGGASFGIGVTNLFDKRPPRIHSRPLFDNEVHDPRGRIIYTTLKKLF
ncbi:MAG: TonB-dependent receptor, partial [Emcibacteraceae bacterium]|nr:TonB-dependent receptor [Emcibacteraceae bacterium]